MSSDRVSGPVDETGALDVPADGGASTVGWEARLPSGPSPRGRRVVALVDTDSFAKWGAHLLAAAPAGWDLDLRTVATPRSASAKQLRSAFRGLDARLAHLRTTPPTPKDVDAVVEELRVDPPDAVLVSLIGPVAELVIDEVHRRIPDRPVLVSGLPGISFPAKWKGIFFRARADLFVLHSHREVRAYEEMAIGGGVEPHFALATLPFARSGSTGATASASTGANGAPVRDAVVFAAQPSVPLERVDRALVVEWLVATARQHPEWRVVIKTRAAAGEHQTHREEHPYPDLVPADAPANLVVESGPMAEHLDRAVALVTISSTAVLEAAARGVPALTLTDFGIGRHLINEVFVSSGLEGDSVDLVDGRFGTVRPSWMQDNYFHPASDDDWQRRLTELMVQRDAGTLVDREPARRSRGGVLRRAWERKNALGGADRSALGWLALVIGAPIRTTKRLARKATALVDPPEPVVVAAPTSQRAAGGAGGERVAGGAGGERVAGGAAHAASEGLGDRQQELVAGGDAG
ncbi:MULTISPECIES: DUF6716 putative glycosyltransferase [unclassified Curtobacterium]|uniref:DUF6716 putative glycosyltransferase n=1 Tax=unclassified Curtobacterium TaxID=257496 RepID=UPI000F47891D|nr:MULTISPECIES: DUF6716 putative glycosyltransferase [unclassified Curtobacterium]ROQ03978.1 hypothetical protein EDF41_3538 [Curtobacterium sp. PhB171]ROQ19243.1 hypothetical protein EDF40_3480 [Curtobacterium sp. PhB170]ROS32855.1 hypothetical protein EDF25_3518 [Curtobacterium sp. PhB131]ROS64418.1 hypothetical protein EDF30_3643 [Curtobacterium sp. PhB141]